MGQIAVVGEALRIQGFALAGALTVTAESPSEVAAAMDRLPAEVTVIVLTAAAAAALGEDSTRTEDRLVAVMPP